MKGLMELERHCLTLKEEVEHLGENTRRSGRYDGEQGGDKRRSSRNSRSWRS